MLKKRVLTALWGIPLLVIAVWFSEPEYSFPLFTVVAAVWGLLAAFEFYRMVGVLKVPTLAGIGLLFTLLFILSPHFKCNLNVPLSSLFLTAAVVLPMIMMIFLPKKEGLFNNWAWMMAGILYIGWLLSYIVELRLEPGTNAFPDAGRNFVFLALFTTFGSDTAAYFIGRALGKHKLAPQISPGKTWEGAIAGLFGAVIISLLFTLNTPLQLPLSYGQAILLGLLISIFGQLGDLAESLLKRNAGVKDSGSLMPGHGGLLDRMDSIVFAGVVVYLYYIFVVV
jgi:phosphatidate cytidylyltransferase